MTILGSMEEGYLVEMSSEEIRNLSSLQYRHCEYKYGSEIDISRVCELLLVLTNNKDRLVAIKRDAEFLVALMDGEVDE
jgi:hypothetical protein